MVAVVGKILSCASSADIGTELCRGSVYETNNDQIMLVVSSIKFSITEAFLPLLRLCGLKYFLLAAQSTGTENSTK